MEQNAYKEMEDLYLSSLLRLRQQMSPIRETFPQVQLGNERPEFRFSYQYLRSYTLPIETESPKKKRTKKVRQSPVKTKQPTRAKTDPAALLKPAALGTGQRTQPPTAGSSFVQDAKCTDDVMQDKPRVNILEERLSN